MRLDLLKLLGTRYLIDTVIEAHNEHWREEAYRTYVTDSFMLISSALGGKMNKRYYDMIHPEPVDERSGMEIAKERLASFGIEVVD